MNIVLPLILSVVGGAMLGIIFFGGLWLTIRNGVSSRYPAAWFGISMLLRTGIVLGGFYVIAGGQIGRLIAGLAGFILARMLVMRWTRSTGAHMSPKKETSYDH